MSTPPNMKPSGQAKSIIITGGASGIGLAMARHFASQEAAGHRICILDIDSSGQEIATKIQAEFSNSTISESSPHHHPVHVTFKKCDVSSWEDQARVFKEVFDEHGGRLDIVMANAGVSEQGKTTAVDLSEDLGEDDEPKPPNLKVLGVNLNGVVYSVKLATHYMKKPKPRGQGKDENESETERGGSIICTASNAGLYPFPIAPLYASSKAGVINLVRSLAKPLSGLDIKINALAPATVETNIAGPDKTLFKHMVITPMTTLLRGVEEIFSDKTITGQVAEIHGDKVTFRPHHEYVDDDSRENLLVFERLGYA